jgi:uncharacterized spore protein YtfJ
MAKKKAVSPRRDGGGGGSGVERATLSDVVILVISGEWIRMLTRTECANLLIRVRRAVSGIRAGGVPLTNPYNVPIVSVLYIH